MSPHTYFQESERGRYEMNHAGDTLELHDGTILQFPFDFRHNLPSMGAPLGTSVVRLGANPGGYNDVCYDPFQEGAFDSRFGSECFGRDIFLEPTDLALLSLDVFPAHLIPQNELLMWHWRLGHAHMLWILQIMRPHKHTDKEAHEVRPVIPVRHPKTPSCAPPMCMVRLLAKQKRRTTASKTTCDKESTVTRAPHSR
jgi:hypothetical protein